MAIGLLSGGDEMMVGLEPNCGSSREFVECLRFLCIDALPRMYRPSERIFAFRLRRENGRDVLDGVSHRYTAIVLIALAGEPHEVAEDVLGTCRPEEVLAGLIEHAESTADLGEVALTLWAARAFRHSAAKRALDRLRAMRPDAGAHTTVEVAWTLSALAVPGGRPTDEQLAGRLADRLMRSVRPGSALFPHWPVDARRSPLRSHVACYADLVYPIQGLAFFHRATGSPEARDIAGRCAQRVCELQGPEGQWWWHYDIRSGRVLEEYPVYAIHQDAMGPMALFDLQDCCGFNHFASIRRSMGWLLDPPEIPGSLIDGEADLIWRKVARHEPGKMARNLQAGLSRLHPRLRMPGIDVLFPVGYIDYETRPYHMGWMLYAWNPGRIERLWPREPSSAAAY